MIKIFDNIGSWFKKVFKNVPAWNVVALSTLNLIAPLLETVLAFADPSAGALIDPIVTQIQADLGTASQLLSAGNTVNLSSLLKAIQSNFSALIAAAHITNPTSVARAQEAETAITSELEAIIAAIPAQS
jgi:hypothetical protein